LFRKTRLFLCLLLDRPLQTPIHYDETPGVTGYNDITPRLGLAWDLFGTGRTSL